MNLEKRVFYAEFVFVEIHVSYITRKNLNSEEMKYFVFFFTSLIVQVLDIPAGQLHLKQFTSTSITCTTNTTNCNNWCTSMLLGGLTPDITKSPLIFAPRPDCPCPYMTMTSKTATNLKGMLIKTKI
jgi:hypothetical protein